MTESSQEENIELLTYSEVIDVKGAVGSFEVTIKKKPRYVDADKCTGCGTCIEKCPTKVPSEFELGLTTRKAIYVPFSQAVPNIPVIDTEHCRKFTKGKCGVCEKVCPAGAIDYEQKEELITVKVGAIIVATGYSLMNPSIYEEYGYGTIKNVVTSLHIERMLESGGPTGGKVINPKTGEIAKNVVFIQCVGSRDEAKGMPYCSKICCMYTAKHAILIKDHQPETNCYVFYIDIRAAGKGYEEFVNRAQREGAVYLRGRPSKIYEKGNTVIVEGVDTLSGKKVEIEADLVVLATAVVPNEDARKLAETLRISTDDFGFYQEAHPKLQPVETTTTGVFLAGACQFAKDIPDSVAAGSAAAAKVCNIFSQDKLKMDPRKAHVEKDICTGCLNCMNVCPYNAIETEKHNGRTVAKVNVALCQGCGNCAATCRTGAITVGGFTDDQIYSQIEGILREEEHAA